MVLQRVFHRRQAEGREGILHAELNHDRRDVGGRADSSGSHRRGRQHLGDDKDESLADNISQNAVSVVVDPLNHNLEDKFLTWLKIYSMRYNAVTGDYRSYALVNAITYR